MGGLEEDGIMRDVGAENSSGYLYSSYNGIFNMPFLVPFVLQVYCYLLKNSHVQTPNLLCTPVDLLVLVSVV